jgi:tetratricopeptide (TPR) repeat protein
MQKAQLCKENGNAAFKAGDMEEALREYAAGVGLDTSLDHLLLCNMAAAELRLHMFQNALESATRSIELNPDWSKAHYRQGEALLGLGQRGEALEAFLTAQQCETENENVTAAIAKRIQQLGINEGSQIKQSGTAPAIRHQHSAACSFSPLALRHWTMRRVAMRLSSMAEGIAFDIDVNHTSVGHVQAVIAKCFQVKGQFLLFVCR